MPFIELQSVDSTNNYALQLIHEGLAQHGTLVLAHHQTAGKGQRGKTWVAEAGRNLTMSLIIKPGKLLPGNQFRLSCAVAIGTLRSFRQYAGNEVKIKWPNDIYWRDRKAGGILIENLIRSGNETTDPWPWSVIGIGINVNQPAFPEGIGNPVSLMQITGKTYSIPDLARSLAAEILSATSQPDHFPTQLAEYNSHLFKKGEQVTLKKGSRVFATRIEGVDETGCLVTRNGIEEEFTFGEVEWIL